MPPDLVKTLLLLAATLAIFACAIVITIYIYRFRDWMLARLDKWEERW